MTIASTADKVIGSTFDEKSLPKAIGELFAMNNYDVRYSVEINGAEVDIVATPRGDPFAAEIYVEATVQYVDVTKYGKDMTKFSLIREQNPAATCVSISTKGFTPSVAERALKTRILAYTYDQLFSRFEKFAPYVDSALANPIVASLIADYEEPYLRDGIGEHPATDWLNRWLGDQSPKSNWLIILGEYGTGKTALTLVLRDMWLRSYKSNPSSPIPIRIELKNFIRQFDARSLLHHFLDTNNLSHVPIEFMRHLISTGRVVLILDGYDEMAQFLNGRERRACLAALAELSSDGARGILTSRPNYFTESEELNVFDALYTSLEKNKYYVSESDKSILMKEQEIDNLLGKYIFERNERYLRDLNHPQTEALVRRKLVGDVAGQDLVLRLLGQMFRDEVDGSKQSLGGKPVIVSFLLELIDDIRADPDGIGTDDLSEWKIYKLIIDRLMIRDLHRSPGLDPSLRRASLQRLAIYLAKRDVVIADEQAFMRIIEDIFKSTLRRLGSDERRARRDEFFQDLRSSATLTRREEKPDGWIFSHNSLREFLVAEALVARLVAGMRPQHEVTISDAMRSFVASLTGDVRDTVLSSLRDIWPQRGSEPIGLYLSLCWDLLRRGPGLGPSLAFVCGGIDDGTLNINDIQLDSVELSNLVLCMDKLVLHAKNGSLAKVKVCNLNLSRSDFTGSVLDEVSFENCVFDKVVFRNSLIFDCELIDVNLAGADFCGLDPDSNFIFRQDARRVTVSGAAAVGLLNYQGAKTDEVDPFFVWQNHPKFPIVLKICENISDQRNSQLRGLTQRGVAQGDPRFARAFLDFLVRRELVTVARGELVSATAEGRRVIPLFVDKNALPEGLPSFLAEWK